MSPYRLPPTQPSVAPRASWWRLLRAWLRGTPRRLEARRYRLAMRRQSRMMTDFLGSLRVWGGPGLRQKPPPMAVASEWGGE